MDPVLQEISLNRCRHCDWVVSLWWISSDEAHSQDLDSWDRMALQEKGYRAVRLQIKRWYHERVFTRARGAGVETGDDEQKRVCRKRGREKICSVLWFYLIDGGEESGRDMRSCCKPYSRTYLADIQGFKGRPSLCHNGICASSARSELISSYSISSKCAVSIGVHFRSYSRLQLDLITV